MAIDPDITNRSVEVGNMPLEAHESYAIRETAAEPLYAPSPVSDLVAQRAQTLAVAPEFISELDKLLGFPLQHLPWASFPVKDLPMSYETFRRFLSQYLGSPDHIDDLREHLQEWYDTNYPQKNLQIEEEFRITNTLLIKAAELGDDITDIRTGGISLI